LTELDFFFACRVDFLEAGAHSVASTSDVIARGSARAHMVMTEMLSFLGFGGNLVKPDGLRWKRGAFLPIPSVLIADQAGWDSWPR
jgi:hypothetical protein